MAVTPVRVALAVLVAAALLAAALPAAEDAATARAASAADAQAEGLAGALADLERTSDPTRPGAPGARRTVPVRVPSEITFGASVEYVAVGGVPGKTVDADGPGRDVLAYKLRGRDPTVAAVVPVDLRVRREDGPAPDDEPLVVRSDATVVFRLVRGSDGPVVHTFIRDGAASGGHA